MPRSSHVPAILALLPAGGALQAMVVPGLRAPVPATFTVTVLDSTAASAVVETAAATAINTVRGAGQAVPPPLPDVINLLVKQVNDRLPAGAPVRPSTLSLMKLGDDTGNCAGLQQAILAGDTVSVLIDFSDGSTDQQVSLAVGNPGTDDVIAGTTVTVGLDSPAGLGLAMQFGKARFNEWLLFAENGVFVAETVRFSYGTRQIIATNGRVSRAGAAQ